MPDIGCLAATFAFFIVAIAYTTGCERLAVKKAKP